MRLLGTYRLIPIVLLATGALFFLKSTGLILDGGYTLGERMASRGTQTMTVTVPASPSTPLRTPSTPLDLAGADAKPSWMREMFNYPDAGANAARRAAPDPIVTGSVAGDKPNAAAPPAAPAAVQPPETRPAADARGARIPAMDPPRAPSASERALLERLTQRREELEARNRELDLRENMIKAAEKKLEAKLAEIREAEARVTAGLKQRDDEEAKRFKGIVTMYETMKPRDAAKIFDRLDPRVLLEVVGQINPRRMSEIMGQMNPEVAERLTVELASRATASDRAQNPANLPKIEGRPTGG